MALEQLEALARQPEHLGDGIAVVVGNLGNAIELQTVEVVVEAGDRAARLERDTTMAADAQLKFDQVGRVGQRGADIAIAFLEDRRLGVDSGRERDGIIGRDHVWLVRLDVGDHAAGDVLGEVRILGEHNGHGLAHVADELLRQNRLAVRIETLDAGKSEIDQRNIRDVGAGPDGGDASGRLRQRCVDTSDPAKRDGRPNDTHVKLVRELNIIGESALASQQRAVFKPPYSLANSGHGLALIVTELNTSEIWPRVNRRSRLALEPNLQRPFARLPSGHYDRNSCRRVGSGTRAYRGP
jgi:hypothetical protein